MKVYSVYRAPEPFFDGGLTTFVKEGFSWPAFFFAPAWLIRFAPWSVCAVYAVYLALSFFFLGLMDAGLPSFALSIFFICVSCGIWASLFSQMFLESAGYRFEALVGARSLACAERRYFASCAYPSAFSSEGPGNSVSGAETSGANVFASSSLEDSEREQDRSPSRKEEVQ